MTTPISPYFTEAQLRSEVERCLYCAEKPCLQACPAHCSPADFLMAARLGEAQDLGRAAALILASNPLGETCGHVCPDTLCMDACTRKGFDKPIEIPKAQASILHLARQRRALLPTPAPTPRSESVAVVGAGPAGLAAAATLARMGYRVDIFESRQRAGGAARLIPESRLPHEALDADVAFVESLGNVNIHLGRSIAVPEDLLAQGFSAVLLAAGVQRPALLGVAGDEHTVSFLDYLAAPEKYAGRARVAIVGGGAVAVDCAITARRNGAVVTEMFVRRTLAEMPLTGAERDLILETGIDVTTRTRIREIERKADGTLVLHTVKTGLDGSPKPRLVDLPDTHARRDGFDLVVRAIGAEPAMTPSNHSGIFSAGDLVNGETTVVEAVACGKNAAQKVHERLSGESEQKQPAIGIRSPHKSTQKLKGVVRHPVALNSHFFGIPLRNPFLLSAAPHTDGFEQMKLAYEAGWAGGVMKTAFDGIPIHIPNGYMFNFGTSTYGNSDNVSGHPLDRVAVEIERLRKMFPDRLTAGSTGGSVTGRDEQDRRSWQANTRKLENAGALLVEYSLSCPQGGDGSEGSIVSQNAALSAKIVDWVMEVSDPAIPKLFKLSGAVTSIVQIVRALQEVFKRYPHKKAGITLANSFPALAFRPTLGRRWDEGVVVGLSGEGIVPISYLSLASVSHLGVTVSGNGGVMDYRAAANFLALGCGTVQVCTLAMKHGVGIIDELCSGLSHLLAAKGYQSVERFVGTALPRPITDFMDLPAEKEISDRHAELCQRCGNCTHCGYGAITMAADGFPRTDPSKCVGCSICVKTCFAGAMMMRERTKAELRALCE